MLAETAARVVLPHEDDVRLSRRVPGHSTMDRAVDGRRVHLHVGV